MHDYGCSCILYRKVHSPKMADKELHLEGWLSGSRAFHSIKQERETRKTDVLGPGLRQERVVGEKGGALGHLGSGG